MVLETEHQNYRPLLKAKQSISVGAAKQLSITTNTRPLMPSLTPRWLLHFLRWVDVPTGSYRINHVRYLAESQKIAFTEKGKITPQALRSIPLFKELNEKTLNTIFKGMKRKTIKPDQVIIKQGGAEKEFYIILEGQYDIRVVGRHNKDLVLKTLSEGDYFGEMALLEGLPRAASVISTTNGTLLYLDKKTFQQIMQDPSVKEQLEQSVQERRKELTLVNQYGEVQAPLIANHNGEPPLPRGFVDYMRTPEEIDLSVIQTIIGIHTRINDVYNVPYNQLEEQLRITIENIREREEWEIINNKDFGLLHNVHPNMIMDTRQGPPTPDDLDDLLALVWKKPDFFLAHPSTIAAFGRECTYRGVPPPTLELFGTEFLTWRGIPLVPSDKLMLNTDREIATTDILLMRTGEENQGVVGLYKAGIGSKRVPSLSVQFMGINERSVASYLLSKYFSAAVLVPDALAVLRNVEIGNYHHYE